MTFDPTDDGPFWMDAATREKTRRDVILSGTKKKRMFRKDELQQMLITKGLTMKGKLKDLQAAAQLNDIPIEEVKEKVIEGWENKAKGLLQVLWERGWIDPQVNKPYHYNTINGKKDKKGRDNFIASVRESISRNNVTWLRVQKFAKRAKRYGAGYHVLQQIKEGVINNKQNEQLAESEIFQYFQSNSNKWCRGFRHTDVLWTLTIASVNQHTVKRKKKNNLPIFIIHNF
jgi:hypothetical protein